MGKFYRALRRISPRHQERDRIASNIADLLEEDPVLRVEEFGGSFQLAAKSRLFYRLLVHGRYEPEIADLVKQHVDRSRDSVDVGANIGFFSTLLAKLAPQQKVLAIEPTPLASKRLNANLTRNDVSDRVIHFQGVATNAESEVELALIEGQEEFSSIGKISHPSASTGSSKTIKVPGQCLDDLVKTHNLDVGFIKVDTEGAEHLVFDGALNTLRQHKPVIISELSDKLLREKGSNAKYVIDRIRDCGYEVKDPISPSRPPGTRPYGDIIAIPS